MTMRTRDEVQRAHDMLHSILDRELPIAEKLDSQITDQLTGACLAMCWMLGCGAGNQFAEKLAVMDKLLNKSGVFIRRESPVPMTKEEAQKWRDSR
jgi:hypothetical protein